MCSVDKVQPGVFRVTSIAQEAQEVPVLETFVEVLREWGCSWLWEHMSIEGGTSWVARAITDGLLVAITDGSFIKQIYPHLCLAAFILECSQGRGQIISLFKEASKAANAYRGELLGLMAIRLILVSVNQLHKSLSRKSKGGIQLPGSSWLGSAPPPLLDPVKMQAFGHPEEYTGELLEPDVQCSLLPREGASG